MSAQHRVPVILTRAKAQAERFAAHLPEGTEPIFSPLLDIVFLPMREMPGPDETLLFTSENGVAALAAIQSEGKGQIALCVGNRTAEAAHAAGFAAESADGSAEDLIALASGRDGLFVHVRGVHSRGDVAQRLQVAGRMCRELVLYDQREQQLTQRAADVLGAEHPCLVPLFSPRTAALFKAGAPEAKAAHIICLSPAVADALAGGEYASLSISSAPKAEALIIKLSERLAAIRLETKGVSG